MTIADSLREAAARLAATSDTARLDAELLMAHALGVSRSELLLRHMTGQTPPALAAMVARRAAHEPLAYITGVQEFAGSTFRVTPDVLIPRADSETTLGAALEGAPRARRVLDCGTGSGALLLAFLAQSPQALGVGIDRSPEALAVAQGNAESLGLAGRVALREADWEQPGWADGLGQFDCILANPPYVEAGARLDPDVRDFEPAGALFAGQDGLDAYRVLVPQLPRLLTEYGTAVLEIGAAQARAVTEIASNQGFTASLYKDLAGRPRAIVLRF